MENHKHNCLLFDWTISECPTSVPYSNGRVCSLLWIRRFYVFSSNKLRQVLRNLPMP